MNVLFVCTGNICRSPVAEHLLRDTVGDSGITVSSAGTTGMTGYPMDPRSLAFLADRGIDGSGFTARRVNRRILQDADLVVGLEKSHVDSCLRLAPAALKRTYRLHQLAEWHRSGALTEQVAQNAQDAPDAPLSLARLSHLRHSLPRVDHDHTDPVGFTSEHDYRALLDGIAADVTEVAAVAALLSPST